MFQSHPSHVNGIFHMSNIGDGQMAPWHVIVMSSRSFSVDEETYLSRRPNARQIRRHRLAMTTV
jgi:hypothetical protein